MGRARIQFAYSCVSTMISGHTAGLRPEDVALALLALPPETRIVGVQELPITDLSIRFEFVVENPMFDEGAVIQYDYVRACGLAKKEGQEDRLIQFNKFLGLRLDDAILPRPQ